MSVLSPNEVSLFVEIMKLPGTMWADPTSGLSDSGSIQAFNDQFCDRVPFMSIPSASLSVPRITQANTDLYADVEAGYAVQELSVSLDDAQYQTQSVSGNLLIATGALGNELSPETLAEFQGILSQVLKRFLSVSLLYGGYAAPTGLGKNWYYFDTLGGTIDTNGWKQDLSFTGLHEACMTTQQGYNHTWTSGNPLTFTDLDKFLLTFKGSNNGHIDFLLMNSELYLQYLGLWRSISLPQFVVDPLTGHSLLAHNGIPILINDYIMTYEPEGDFYLSDVSNPEYIGGTQTSIRQTSLYALNLGHERQGVFGIYPQSFGDSPLKIESVRPYDTQDALLMRGSIEAGLAFKTTRSVGRMGGILVS